MDSKAGSFKKFSPPLSPNNCTLLLSSSKVNDRLTGEKSFVSSVVGDKPKLRFGDDRRLCIGDARNTRGGDGGEIELSSSL